MFPARKIRRSGEGNGQRSQDPAARGLQATGACDIVRGMVSAARRRHTDKRRGGSAFAAQQVSGQADTALLPKQPSQRLAALLREHRQLLTKIRQKQGERPRLAERIAAAVSAAQDPGIPLLDEIVELDRQLHASFAELFAQQETRKTQKIVRSVYGALQATGILSSSGPQRQR